MLAFDMKSAHDTLGLDQIQPGPAEPNVGHVMKETWEVWTKFGYRSLWRVTHYASGWMDWWLSNVSHLFTFGCLSTIYNNVSDVAQFCSPQPVKQLRCHVRCRALEWNCLDEFRWETVSRLQREFGAPY